MCLASRGVTGQLRDLRGQVLQRRGLADERARPHPLRGRRCGVSRRTGGSAGRARLGLGTGFWRPDITGNKVITLKTQTLVAKQDSAISFH